MSKSRGRNGHSKKPFELPAHLRVYSEPGDPGPITARHGGPLPEQSPQQEQQQEITRRDALAALAGLIGSSGFAGALPVAPAVARARKLAAKLGLSAESTLDEVCEKYYIPLVLTGKGSRDTTLAVVRDALRWWRELTRNPAVFEIDDELITQFKLAIKRAHWQRKGPRATPRFLSPHSIAKILRVLRSVLMRCGPTTHPKRPGLWLVDDVPYVEVSKPPSKIKDLFFMTQAKRMITACDEMEDPQFWRASLCTLFYGGERWMDSMGICEAQIKTVELEGGATGHMWKAAATKTGKPINNAMHPCWLFALEPLRAASPDPNAPLLKWNHCWRHFQREHMRLQKIAGIKEPLPVHAWRRTHLDQCVEVGLALLNHTAKKAGNHSDLQTTRSSYTDPANRARLALPKLFDLPKPAEESPAYDPQRRLFE